MTGASHTLDGFLRAASLEERAVRIVTAIDTLRIGARNWQGEKEKLIRLASEFSPNGISEEQIAEMYLERQRKFIAKKSSLEYNPEVAKSGDTCGWPLGCDYREEVHRDHVLPKSAYYDGVKRFYDKTENSLSLCPTHNSMMKGNHISTGLWIRGMI